MSERIEGMKHKLVRLLVWIDVHILNHRVKWFCNWTWDLQLEDDAERGEIPF